jgi:hypothetical protein
MIPTAPSKEQESRIRDVAKGLRSHYAEPYIELADRTERELGLYDAQIDAAHLGAIDTFRFEEHQLLAHTGELIATKQYEAAMQIVSERRRSFWVDRDVSRQAQWEACRLMAAWGRAIEEVRPALSKMGANPAKWVKAYAGDGGWCEIDRLQRTLETWVAKMDDELETDRALAVVRREHEELLKRMADGFSKVLQEADWTLSGVLHQTDIYPEVV